MKILQIADVPYWAIGHLSQSIVDYNPHLQFKTLYVHPKHVAEDLDNVRAEIDWADIIDYQYWNTARQLLEAIPELRKKKSILTHHNEKDLLAADWSDITFHVVETENSLRILQQKYLNVKLIPLGTDPDFFKYNEKLPGTKVVGYAGRIVPWKGLKEIAQACFELGYKLLIMGKFDKPDYWQSIPPEHQANMDLSFMDCLDNERPEFYRQLDVFVGYSGPGRETGTLPMIEAMASGVPLLTTPAGIAADLCEDHENAIVTPFDSYADLKNNLRMLMENGELKEKIRHNAWNSIKNFTLEKRAWQYEQLYHEVFSEQPLVSVIIPCTPDKKGQARDILTALELSDYKHIEAVVVMDQTNELVVVENPANGPLFSFPIKWLTTDKIGGYNLAMARNMGAIAAIGKYLLFCDNRLRPTPGAITNFLTARWKYSDEEKIWLNGNKGNGKKTFVENFSFIRRDHFIRAGMFNERIDRYGGMSQEVRERFTAQGFQMKYVDDAVAEQMCGSHLNLQRRSDIVASKFKLARMGLG